MNTDLNASRPPAKVGRWILVGIAVLIMGAGWWAHRNHSEKQVSDEQGERKRDSEREAKEQKWEMAVMRFADAHGAFTNWLAQLPDRGYDETLFSIDVSRALIPSNGQPVVLVMRLSDVVEKDGGIKALFKKEGIRSSILFELKCTQAQASKLLQSVQHDLQTYCVVAHIDDVSRAKFRVKVDGADEVLVGESANMTLDTDAPDVFFATGVCIDILQKDEGESQ